MFYFVYHFKDTAAWLKCVLKFRKFILQNECLVTETGENLVCCIFYFIYNMIA